MPNVSNYEDASVWGKNHPKNIGLHLTFMNDDSAIKYKSLSRHKSIEDKDGYLFEDINKFRESIKYREIKEEIDLQFDKLNNSGINISHVDIHRYAIYPTYNPFIYIYLCKKCKKYGNLPIRWARNGGYNLTDGIPNLCDSDNVSKFFAAISDLYSIPIPDYVFKFPYRNTLKSYAEKKNAFLSIIRNLPEGISEIHIHPSIESEEIKKINPTWEERVLEYKLMMDDDISDEMKKCNVKLITYKDIKNNKSKLKSIYEIFYYGSRYVAKKILR